MVGLQSEIGIEIVSECGLSVAFQGKIIPLTDDGTKVYAAFGFIQTLLYRLSCLSSYHSYIGSTGRNRLDCWSFGSHKRERARSQEEEGKYDEKEAHRQI